MLTTEFLHHGDKAYTINESGERNHRKKLMNFLFLPFPSFTNIIGKFISL